MGLFSDIGKISGEVWSQMPLRDKVALITSPVPFLGTATGLFADSITMAEDPSALNAGFLASNVIPGARIARVLGKTANKAIRNITNYLPGFYSGNPLKIVGGVAYGGLQGDKNITKQAYSPKLQGLWKHHGISPVEHGTIKKSVQQIEGTYNPSIVGKARDKVINVLDSKGKGPKAYVLDPQKKALG